MKNSIFNHFPQIMEMESKTKQGLDKLELMVRIMSVLEVEVGKAKSELNRLKSWLVEKLKRGLTAQEELFLTQGILDYIQSEPATDERMNAMKYLFDAEFLTKK